jgi:PAS domain S-box-containing protein
MMPGNSAFAILIIEDDGNDAALVLYELRKSGFDMTAVVVDSNAAVRAALTTKTWDIILCDYTLHGLSFNSVIDLIKAHAPGVPVVLVTGTVGEEAVGDLVRRGLADVVFKNRLGSRLAPVVAREVAQARQRRVAKLERTQNEASFKALFESSPMPTWVVDGATLAFLEVNTAAIARYGWSREEFLSRSIGDVEPGKDQATLRAARPSAPGRECTIETSHVTAAGERLAVRVALHGIEYRGRFADLAVIWDVTAMERARDELNRANADLAEMATALTSRTSELIDAARLAGMGTWSLTFSPRATVLSTETYSILGQQPAAFQSVGMTILTCVHPDDRAMFRAGYSRMGITGTPHEMEYRIVRPSGEIRVIRELARPKHDANGRTIGMAGVIQDITEQKAAGDALLRAEKLKTIDQVMGGIAHDFNNLLTIIGLNIDAVVESVDLPEDLRSILKPALHAAHRGGELTAQMLSYARRQSLTSHVVNLSALIETLQPLLTRATGERHKLTIEVPRSDLCLKMDPGQFENALMNLVLNARDAMQANGRIDITFAVIQLSNPLVRFPDLVPPGKYVRVRVVDSGQGISAEVLPRIFEPFFTTKRPGTGSGLGLSMVYGFVRQTQGKLMISSAPGVGTTIDLYFPMTEILIERPIEAPVQLDFVFKNRSVLVVEDSDDLRRATHNLFAELGFETTSVATAADAVDVLQSSRRIDVLFSDITLAGGVDGAELGAMAESLRRGIVVVLTSGNAHQIETGSLTRWTFLPKPFRAATLIELLGSIFKKQDLPSASGSKSGYYHGPVPISLPLSDLPPTAAWLAG